MSNRIYVGNVSYTTSPYTLQTVFMQVGTVLNVSLARAQETGGRGAVVTMATQQMADEAISRMNGYVVDGRPLSVGPYAGQ